MTQQDFGRALTRDTERLWAAATTGPIDGALAITHAQLIDALLFNEEMAEDDFIADPTPTNYQNLLWARSHVENMNGPCQRGCCGHSGELHEFTCLVEGCACPGYALGEVPVTGHPPTSQEPEASLVAA